MPNHIEEFATALRDVGVRVSTAELTDALRAVARIGHGEPRRLRAALRATLVKRVGDRESFDDLFELFFAQGAGLGPDVGAASRALPEQLAAALAEVGELGRWAVGLEPLDLGGLVAGALASVDVAAIRSPLQIGAIAYRAQQAIGVEGAGGGLAAALDRALAGGLIDAAERDGLAERAEASLARLRSSIRTAIAGELRRRNAGYVQELGRQLLSDKPLALLDRAEREQLKREIDRLARVLRARLATARRLDPAGGIDLSRTLRRAMASDGVPAELVHRRRRRKRPRLVVLCDVSDSVRNVSRFMLQLVHALHELFDGVYSFAFVDELGQLTEVFRRFDARRAIGELEAGRLVNLFASSNYGRVLDSFARDHIGLVNRRTTVLIIGDGRNNNNPTGEPSLAAVARRAHRVWWINPEPRSAWGLGDSEMPRYGAHCTQTFVVFNLVTLRDVVDRMLAD